LKLGVLTKFAPQQSLRKSYLIHAKEFSKSDGLPDPYLFRVFEQKVQPAEVDLQQFDYKKLGMKRLKKRKKKTRYCPVPGFYQWLPPGLNALKTTCNE